MDYKLALELKKAGYPQFKIGGTYWVAQDKPLNTMFGGQAPEETVLIPTLSELIEACGDSFESLVQHRLHIKQEIWVANGNGTKDKYGVSPFISCKEETPLIAVAKLYIKLSKK